MREAPYPAVLFDVPESEHVTHYFYATTNSVAIKVGMAKDVEKRMKRDRQFRGHVLIWTQPCNCVPHVIDGRRKCVQELAWEDAHAVDRLPRSEHYRPSSDIKRALYWRARSSPRAMAVMHWLEEHTTGRTA